MKTTLRSPFIQFSIAMLGLAGLFMLLQKSAPSFNALPISGISTRTPPPAVDPATLTNLHPLFAKAAEQATPAPTPDDVIPVDDVFIPKSVSKEALAVKTPDYFLMLNTDNRLTLQAISDDGAIISQKFYRYGAPLTDWAYPGPSGKEVAPILRPAKQTAAVRIEEHPGSRSFLLKLTQE